MRVQVEVPQSQDLIMDPHNDIPPASPHGDQSPFSPLRKTRVISTSITRSTSQLYTHLSPMNLWVQNSPIRLGGPEVATVESFRLLDDESLPILRLPAGIGRVGQSYVTRSLFRDPVADHTEISESISVIPAAEIKSIPVSKLVGLSVDVLTVEELAGCSV
ncbi:hypothetical protein R1sor_019648 [Riccia sorocarpa]|uniref:Uncharacterized protein n=1 Tax=Riccia sorocarpa TaxID=122646 RepID=A0ABD3IE81_9MARC